MRAFRPRSWLRDGARRGRWAAEAKTDGPLFRSSPSHRTTSRPCTCFGANRHSFHLEDLLGQQRRLREGVDSRENVCWKGRRGREREEGGGRRQGRLNARREKDGRQRGSRRKGWEGVCACVCVCHGRVLSSKGKDLKRFSAGRQKIRKRHQHLRRLGSIYISESSRKTHLSWPSPFKAPPDCS